MSCICVVMVHENIYSVVLVRAYLISMKHGADFAKMYPSLVSSVQIQAPYHPAIHGQWYILVVWSSAVNAAEAQWKVETRVAHMNYHLAMLVCTKASMSSYLPRLHFQQMLLILRSFSFYRVPLFYQTIAVSCSPPSLYHLQWPVFLQEVE